LASAGPERSEIELIDAAIPALESVPAARRAEARGDGAAAAACGGWRALERARRVAQHLRDEEHAAREQAATADEPHEPVEAFPPLDGELDRAREEALDLRGAHLTASPARLLACARLCARRRALLRVAQPEQHVAQVCPHLERVPLRAGRAQRRYAAAEERRGGGAERVERAGRAQALRVG
jgi:hypothetical protein